MCGRGTGDFGGPLGASVLTPLGEGADAPRSGFERIAGALTCRGVSLEEAAGEFGTPLYLYDAEGVAERVRRFQVTFREISFLPAYSVKANGSLAILNRIAALGAGADIVSQGELERALRAGFPPERIVFAGVGKGEEEMVAGLRAGIYAFHVESAGELDLLSRVARDEGRVAPVGLRVNPDVESPTPHAYTRTGHAASKFGIPVEEAEALYVERRNDPHLEFLGIDAHIGSQIMETEPYLRAFHVVLGMLDRLREGGIDLAYLDLGGGFGVGYDGEEGLDLEDLAREIVPPIRERGLQLILEPGRAVVGESGVLLTRVRYLKRAGVKTFVITDAGMTELIRPSHYEGFHRILPVRETEGAPRVIADVVGPICESGDFLARDREMSLPQPGELLAVKTAGAYGFTMASNYNARPRPAEVMVEGGEVHLIRRRETLDDLMRGEEIPHPREAPGPLKPSECP